MRRVPNSGKVYSEKDKQALLDFIERGEEIPFGPSYIEFEKRLAEKVGVNKAFFVNSGSSANLLAFSIFSSPLMYDKWRIREGDEIITLAASFPTTIAPIVQYGCVPVFVDITIPEYNIDISMLRKAVTPRTKGVFIAHTLGNPFDITKVEQFCKKYDLFLIVDGCDALGSTYKGKSALAYGQLSTLSFYAAHHMYTGQGGAVFTNDPLIARLLQSFRSWGRHCTCAPNQDNACGNRFNGQHGDLPFGYDHKNTYSEFGYNLMATNIQAALGLSQLEQLDTFTKQRHENFLLLDTLLRESPLRKKQMGLPKATENSDPSWFGYPLLLEPGMRGEFTRFLEGRGIQTRYLFAGNITKQPCFTNNPRARYRVVGNLRNTDRVMNDLVWVGIWHGLTKDDMYYIFDTIEEYFYGL